MAAYSRKFSLFFFFCLLFSSLFSGDFLPPLDHLYYSSDLFVFLIHLLCLLFNSTFSLGDRFILTFSTDFHYWAYIYLFIYFQDLVGCLFFYNILLLFYGNSTFYVTDDNEFVLWCSYSFLYSFLTYTVDSWTT